MAISLIGEIIGAERSRSGAMKRRIAIWASIGFLVACCWILYTFVVPPDYLNMSEPVVEAFAFASCPLVFAFRAVPLSFWWVAPINSATYAVIGLIIEILRRKSNPILAS